MTSLRLVSFPVHGVVELAIGIATMVASYGLGFTPAGTVIGFFVGAATAGLALGTTPDGRGAPAIPVASHQAADYGLALGLGAAALMLALSGDVVAGLVLGTVAACQMLLNVSTRYTARG